MAVIPIIRQVVLGVTTLFSIIVLGISAYGLSQVQVSQTQTAFSALGVAVGVMSLVTLPVMLVVDIFRRGAFTSMIVVELAWLSILWILWVATAGETAYAENLFFPNNCLYAIFVDACKTAQSEVQAIEAFSFLNFIIILLYTGLLTIASVIAANRGQSVWLSSVKESFGSPAGAVQHPMAEYSTSVPPPPQPQAYPTGTSRYAASSTHPGSTAGSPAISV